MFTVHVEIFCRELQSWLFFLVLMQIDWHFHVSVPLKHVWGNAYHVCSSIELSIQCKMVTDHVCSSIELSTHRIMDTDHVCSSIEFSIPCEMVFHEIEAFFSIYSGFYWNGNLEHCLKCISGFQLSGIFYTFSPMTAKWWMDCNIHCNTHYLIEQCFEAWVLGFVPHTLASEVHYRGYNGT